MAIIDDVTALLGFFNEKSNKTLDVIIRLTTNRLKTLLDVEEVPTELEYIVTEVSIVRYNKIGSEGVTNHSVEGETMSFSDNDFKGYLNDIEAWKNKKNEVKGVVKFLWDMTLLFIFKKLHKVNMILLLVTTERIQ